VLAESIGQIYFWTLRARAKRCSSPFARSKAPANWAGPCKGRPVGVCVETESEYKMEISVKMG
jgi:hypothetical protein